MNKYIERWHKVYQPPMSHGINFVERCYLLIDHNPVVLYVGVRNMAHTSRKAMYQEILRLIVAAAEEAGLGAIEFSKHVVDHGEVEKGFLNHWERCGSEPIYCQGGTICYPPLVSEEIRKANFHFRNVASVQTYDRLKQFNGVGDGIVLLIQHHLGLSEKETADLINKMPVGEVLRFWLLAQGVTVPSEDILNTVIALGYRLPVSGDSTPLWAKQDVVDMGELEPQVVKRFEDFLYIKNAFGQFNMAASAAGSKINGMGQALSAQVFDSEKQEWVDL